MEDFFICSDSVSRNWEGFQVGHRVGMARRAQDHSFTHCSAAAVGYEAGHEEGGGIVSSPTFTSFQVILNGISCI